MCEHRQRTVSIVTLALIVGLLSSPEASFGFSGFTCVEPVPMAQQISEAHIVALVEWVRSDIPPENGRGDRTTTFKVMRLFKNALQGLVIGQEDDFAGYQRGERGSLFMLTGVINFREFRIDWKLQDSTEASFDYAISCPEPAATMKTRLEFYIKHLEHADDLIASDVFLAIASTPFADLRQVADKLPKKELVRWVLDDVCETRRELYGTLIGICGDAKYVKLIEREILKNPEDFRLGIDGVMSGYLLLTGEEGLAILDQHKLRNRKIPFSETYAAMNALRFMWRDGDGRIEKERLGKSMRILLDRPELAELVIADLARWEDWGEQDRIAKMYGEGEFNITSIKKAIVRYLIRSSGEFEKDPNPYPDNEPEHRKKAREYLESITKRDPKTVENARRFLKVEE